jgi:ketosteroid isomerase-like protein
MAREPEQTSPRELLIQAAYDALDGGDLAPFRTLFDPDARWIGVPHGDETAVCSDRKMIVDRLAHHHDRGRRFELGKLIEDGDRVAVETTVHEPAWSGPVTFFKVFTFRPGSDVVVQLNDCIDESYARRLLAQMG